MRQLVLTDIHGNAIALDHLLEAMNECQHLAFDAARVLGDVFGYYPDPLSVWQRAIALDPELRLGNHELVLRDRLVRQQAGLTPHESEAAAWTLLLHQHQLAATPLNEQAAVAARLAEPTAVEPRVECIGRYAFVYVHGAPFFDHTTDDHALSYLHPSTKLAEREEIERALRAAAERAPASADRVLLCVGHSHQPLVVSLNANGNICWHSGAWSTPRHDAPIALDPLFEQARVVMINPGAVGYPRAARALAHHAHAAIIDTEAHTLRMVALDLLGEPLDRFFEAMRAWEAGPARSTIEAPLRAYYRSRPRDAHWADASWADLEDHWQSQVRSQLLDHYFAGIAAGEHDAYDYSADGFTGRSCP